MKQHPTKLCILAVLFSGFLTGCEGQTPVSSQQSSSSPSSGAGASDAKQSAFSYTIAWPAPAEKGKEVSLAKNQLVKNYYVVLDGSGSMADKGCSGSSSKEESAKRILTNDFIKLVPQDANLGLLIFDSDGLSERVPLGTGQENREAFIKAVQKSRAGGGTPLHNAIATGYNKLEEQGRRQLGYGEYHLVAVTDGEANAGQDPTGAVNFIVAKTPVIVETVGFCIGSGHSLNQPGRTTYRAADNDKSLRQGLAEVLAESPNFDAKAFQNQ